MFFEKNVSCKFYALPVKTFEKTNSYRQFFFEKKFKINLFGFFVPFDVLVHMRSKNSQKTRKTENN